MNSRTSFALSAAILAAGTLVLSAPALAQSTPSNAPAGSPTSAPASGYEAVIAEESAMVRSAPNAESGYPFGMLGKGAKVRVVQEDLGWARVATGGESFREWFGFVVASPGIELAADGRRIKVNSRAEIRAPRADANWAPDASWKPIGFLVAGDELEVLESVRGERDVFYKVALNEKSSGWIPLSALSRPAATAPEPTPAEVDTETDRKSVV